MARKATTDTVDDKRVGGQPGEKAERSDYYRQCEICQFLYVGYRKAHSKQAKAEYGEGFLEHFTTMHHDVFGDI